MSSMPWADKLEQRIAELEAENERLRAQRAEFEVLWNDATCLLGKSELKLAEARAVLKEVEWVSGQPDDQCPVCCHAHERGWHADDCRLAAMLGFETCREI